MSDITPIVVTPITTPKTLSPEELEIINRNFFEIQEVIKKVIAKLPP